MKKFDFSLDYKKLNLRGQPEFYAIARGEEGVLLVEPYKSQVLPLWCFKNPEVALESSSKIHELFLQYLKDNDFVGADMARNYLQMGFTRARCYANHKGGKKYDGPVPGNKKGQRGSHGRKKLERQPEDSITAEAAAIFKAKLELAKNNVDYLAQKKRFSERFD